MGEIITQEYSRKKQNNSLPSLSFLKEFVSIPFFIPWYKSKESNKVFPILLQEIGDINPIKRNPLSEYLIGHNPFFEHVDNSLYVVIKNKKPIGRIMAFVDNKYNKKNNTKAGWLGMFECIENKDYAKCLLETSISYLKTKGCEEIIGPAKFNANGEVGLLIDGFEHKPYFMEPYNAPYYQTFFEDFGFKKLNDWYSVVGNFDTFEGYSNRIKRLNEKLQNNYRIKELKDVKIRNINFNNLEEEIKKIRKIYNKEWSQSDHPQFVKMTKNEFNYLAQGIKEIALEELIFIAEKNNTPIGVSVTLPNINEVIEEYDSNSELKEYKPSKKLINLKDIKRDVSIYTKIKNKLKQKNFETARILILGVTKKYRKKGIESLLYFNTAKALKNMDMKKSSGSQLADVNLNIINPLTKMGNKAFTWRVYKTKL